MASRELAERAFRPLRASRLLRGASAARGPLSRFCQDHQLGDLLTHVRFLVRTGFLGPVENEIDAPGALWIPLVGLIGRFQFSPLFHVDPSRARAPLRR